MRLHGRHRRPARFLSNIHVDDLVTAVVFARYDPAAFAAAAFSALEHDEADAARDLVTSGGGTEVVSFSNSSNASASGRPRAACTGGAGLLRRSH